MTSRMTQYRRAHPEYYEAEKKRDNERMKEKYANDPISREKTIKRALDRYYRLKAEKEQQQQQQQQHQQQPLNIQVC
jgi:hypothetical protein